MTSELDEAPRTKRVLVIRHEELPMVALSFETDGEPSWIRLWVPNDIARGLANNIMHELPQEE